MTIQSFHNDASRPLKKFGKLLRLKRTVRNWPRTLLDHLHFTKANYVCDLGNGISLEVRGGTDDRHVIFEVFVEHIYPVPVGEGNVVIDIGAHIGCFTVWAARQGARVYAFEPFPPNFAALQRNVARNQLNDVQLFNLAVAGKRERKELFLPNNKTHSSRCSLYPERGTETIDVECVSLDDIVSANRLEHVELLKIDCQGAEYEILYGASAHTLAKISAIVAECENFEDDENRSVAGMTKHLESVGFKTDIRKNLIFASRC